MNDVNLMMPPEASATEDAPFDAAAIAARLADERGADIVEALNHHTPAEAAAILEALPAERAFDTLDQPGLDEAPEIIAAMSRERGAYFLANMAADRVADVFRLLEEPARGELL